MCIARRIITAVFDYVYRSLIGPHPCTARPAQLSYGSVVYLFQSSSPVYRQDDIFITATEYWVRIDCKH